jgi:hypothetical protein
MASTAAHGTPGEGNVDRKMFWHRMRRRGGFLFFRAFIYAGYGFSLVALTETSQLDHTYRVATALLPIHVWGWIWLSTAAIIAVSAFVQPPRDYVGFTLGAALPLVWAVLAFLSWLQNDAVASDRTWVTAVVMVGLGGSMLIVAGMADPPLKP